MGNADPVNLLRVLIAQSERIVLFTGAGISTESGVPDFRSPGGVWTRMKPITLQEFVRDEGMRREAWRRRFLSEDGMTGAKPNAGHAAVHALIASGRASCVITQNIDNLHQDAGTPQEKVLEIHGNATYATCLECEARHELADLAPPFLERGIIPECRNCGGLVKVATISFGQAMPEALMAQAKSEALTCDLFIVLGSSLVVYPAAALPLLAKRNGARLVIVNRDPTDQDEIADLVIHDSIGKVMSAAIP